CSASSRKRKTLTIDCFLERRLANAAIGVDEPLAVRSQRSIDLDRGFHRVDDTVFAKAGADDLGEAGILGRRSAERELVILLALLIDAQYANVPGMMMAAGVDAARYLHLQFAQI